MLSGRAGICSQDEEGRLLDVRMPHRLQISTAATASNVGRQACCRWPLATVVGWPTTGQGDCHQSLQFAAALCMSDLEPQTPDTRHEIQSFLLPPPLFWFFASQLPVAWGGERSGKPSRRRDAFHTSHEEGSLGGLRPAVRGNALALIIAVPCNHVRPAASTDLQRPPLSCIRQDNGCVLI